MLSCLQWLQRQAAPAESASSSGQTSPRVHTPAVTERLVAARPHPERTPFERLIAERTLSERCERSPLHSPCPPLLHCVSHSPVRAGGFQRAGRGSTKHSAGCLSRYVVCRSSTERSPARRVEFAVPPSPSGSTDSEHDLQLASASRIRRTFSQLSQVGSCGGPAALL